MDDTNFFHIRDIVSRMSEFNFNRYFLEIIAAILPYDFPFKWTSKKVVLFVTNLTSDSS